MKYTKPLNHLNFIRCLLLIVGLCSILMAFMWYSAAQTVAVVKPPAQKRTESKSAALPKYDIRLGDQDGFEEFDLTSIPGRERAGQNAQARARLTVLDQFLTTFKPGAGEKLRAIANQTGALKNFFVEGGTLSEPQSDTADNVARKYLSRHANLFALQAGDLANLKLVKEVNDEGTTFLEYVQTLSGIKVYEGHVQVVVNQNGEVLSVREGFLVGDQAVKLKPTLNETQGIVRAFEHAGKTVAPALVETHKRGSQNEMSRFANPLDSKYEEVLSELTVLRVGDTARLAWRVYADVGPGEWYEILVDAHTGELLVRNNLYVSEAQGTVYTNSPSKGSPVLVQFPASWIGSSTQTKGPNVDAYLDTDADNLPDPIDDFSYSSGGGLLQGRAYAPDQNFTFPFSTDVDPRTQQPAVLTNLFYFVNFMHDFSYNLGFNETSGNFQDGDYVLAEAQDPIVSNNANFATPPDGVRPRMQMGIFSAFPADHDSSLDGDVVFHEYGHGISNRIINNGDGALSGTQSGALNEGWSDYWAATINGDGAIGEYVANSSIGLRRAKYAIPADPRHDSYRDLGNEGFEPHNDGEIWAATLWDLRAQLGATTTNRLVFRGLRFTPTRPSFLAARDGILQADQNLNGGANRCTIWTVFARHGMGASAFGGDDRTHDWATDLPTDCGGTPQAYDGYVDGADCDQIWGWAWDASKPNQSIDVDIYDGSRFLANVAANLFRQDLVNAGKGNGYHAFVFNTPSSLKNGQWHTINVKFGGISRLSLNLSARKVVCGASLFSGAVPQATASGQGASWEQGLEFSSEVSGTITHVRFWRAAEEPQGNHTGRIWGATGTQLASASFVNETISAGWQSAKLQTPLPISANVRYKVSYNINSVVAKTFNVFNGPITRSPLTAWGATYSTPGGTFPTTASTSNLFADVLFNSPR